MRRPGNHGRQGKADLWLAAATAAAACAFAVAAQGCGADPNASGTASGGGATQTADELTQAQTINGVRVSFLYADYFGLTSPNAEGCAGDVRNYYDPVALNAPGSTLNPSLGFDSVQGVAGLGVAAGLATGPTGPMVFPQDTTTNVTQTIRPSFIKNISVDMTDANSVQALNLASGCSLGNGPTVPATSSCATFDYGAIGGIPSTLGGTMLIIGGVENYNYSAYLPPGQQQAFPFQGAALQCGSVVNQTAAMQSGATAPTGYTQCSSGIYALGVNTLPQSAFQSDPTLVPSYEGTSGPSGPISMWGNISGAAGFTGPSAYAGSSVTYDPGLQQVLLFGGSSPLAAFGSSGPGVTTYDTWLLNLQTQQWAYLTANIYVPNAVTTLLDTLYDIEGANEAALLGNVAPSPEQIPMSSGTRSLMGYIAVPGMGTNIVGSNTPFVNSGTANTGGAMTKKMIDPTDRLMIVGGYNGIALWGTHRFNPTYGPELQNVYGALATTDTILGDFNNSEAPDPNAPMEWITSYHTQLLANSYGALFRPGLLTTAPSFPGAAPTTFGAVAFGKINSAGTAGTAPEFLSTPYTQLSSRFTPDLPPFQVGPTGGQPVANSAFVPLTNNAGSVAGSIEGTGYILGVGGFDMSSAANLPDIAVGDDISRAVCTMDGNDYVDQPAGNGSAGEFSPSYYGTNTYLYCGGGMSISSRFYGGMHGGGATNAETHEGNVTHWSGIPDFNDTNADPATPFVWSQLMEAADTSAGNNSTAAGKGGNFVDFLGGQTLLPGFNLKTNDVVLFGGLDCTGYIANTTAPCSIGLATLPSAPAAPSQNPPSIGRYYSFGTEPLKSVDVSTQGPSWGSSATALSSSVPNDQIPWPRISGTTTTAEQTWNPYSHNMPYQAGMASARGVDPSGNIVIIAWGGAVGAATVEGLNKIYYLSNANGTTTANGLLSNNITTPNTSQWGYASPQTNTVQGAYPAEMVNAAMVFSHVTRKFYLFGGYDPSSQTTHGDTYEISLVNASASSTGTCALGANELNPCAFVWRKLDQGANVGLTCYPTSCPEARRSHRMAEVNYFNRNPGGNGGASVAAASAAFFGQSAATYFETGEQDCTETAPCSYGIFMEGGTPDGINFLADRWIFDPTANGGNGSWLEANEFPPRALASMSAVDITLPSTGQIYHRAVLFGGETGMSNAEWAPTGNFVPPTLGDTWMFDFDNQSWNRVQLQGQGYNGSGSIPGTNPSGDTTATEFTHRQAFDATNPTLYPGSPGEATGLAYQELSPPPLSGAVMVTRTQGPPPTGVVAATGLVTLNLPEIYLFGGRLKDGSFNPLSNVYKFCAGSTGEAFTFSIDGVTESTSVPDPGNYTCDAFDPVYNPASPSPTNGYVGRWLTKQPDIVTTNGTSLFAPSSPLGTIAPFGSYLGAGAYDLVRDRIVLFGGLTSLAPLTNGGDTWPTSVTDLSNLIADASVWEYTPPQPALQLNATTNPKGSNHPREGRWTFVPSCAGYAAPAGRYGHSMSYNTLGQNVILVGGYAAGGTPLTTSIADPSSNTSYSMPEVWTGNYCGDPSCGDNLVTITQNAAAPLLTNAPCYLWEPVTIFGNSTAIQSQVPPETGLAHAASVYIPATGYNLGYYATFDSACANEGPIDSPDPSLNRLLAGGAYIDIDRTQLSPNENLMLTLTYLPLGTTNVAPNATPLTADQAAVFRVHLIKTGQTAEQLEAALQPRYMTYANTMQYPQVVQTLSVLAPPTGQLAQEQVLLPITVDPAIDRIRIERYSGTAILINAAVYRLGTK